MVDVSFPYNVKQLGVHTNVPCCINNTRAARRRENIRSTPVPKKGDASLSSPTLHAHSSPLISKVYIQSLARPVGISFPFNPLVRHDAMVVSSSFAVKRVVNPRDNCPKLNFVAQSDFPDFSYKTC